MKQQIHVWYAGRVQGVGFRMTAEEAAHRTGVAGWVKNLRDGRVEVVAEGEKQQLIELVDAIRYGPMRNFIQHIHVEWNPATNAFSKFEIRYF